VWKIKRFTGASEHSLRAEVTMVSTTKERKPWARPPISMNFQVRVILVTLVTSLVTQMTVVAALMSSACA
jgi:hypothetical protein